MGRRSYWGPVLAGVVLWCLGMGLFILLMVALVTAA